MIEASNASVEPNLEVEATQSPPYRIMICEDERIVAMDIKRALEGFGYAVVGTTATGIEAIDMAKDFRPDLALMDIRLQGEMNGIEVAKIIGERFGVPVIYLSAYANPEIVEQSKSTEPLAYLVKPFEDRELRSAVEIGIARYKKQLALEREIEASRAKLREQTDDSSVADRVLALHRELMEVEKMEAIQTMAGGLAHHLNNLLAVIQGNVELLMEDESLSPTSAKLAKRAAVDSCERMSWIIKQFLWFSDRGIYTVRQCSASEIVATTIKEAAHYLRPGIELIDNLPASALKFMVDREQVKRSLLNVILNAQDAMPHGGAISISAGEVYEAYPERLNRNAKPGWYVVIRVTDWGNGISDEYIDRIVEPFYTTKKLGEGVGLGLTLAYGVLHSHCGWIDFDSRQGRGTTVSFYLPRLDNKASSAIKPASSEVEAARQPEMAAKPSVLLISNDEKMTNELGEVINSLNLRNVVINDFNDGLAWYSPNCANVDVVCLDVELSHSDIKEWLSEIRMIKPSQRIMLLTANPHDPLMQEAGIHGPVAVFEKHFSLQDIGEWFDSIVAAKPRQIN